MRSWECQPHAPWPIPNLEGKGISLCSVLHSKPVQHKVPTGSYAATGKARATLHHATFIFKENIQNKHVYNCVQLHSNPNTTPSIFQTCIRKEFSYYTHANRVILKKKESHSIRASFDLHQGYNPENRHANETQNSHLRVFPGGQWTDLILYSVWLYHLWTYKPVEYICLYIHYTYISIQYIYLFISTAIKM